MILGVESSCDESALAFFRPETGLCGEWVHSQIQLHQPYGGIVPDLASREHLTNFPPMLEVALQHQREASLPRVTQIAVTAGPGLAGSLALGLSMAKALGVAWRVPVVGVNHLRGHAYSPFIGLHAEAPELFADRLDALLPHLGLIVSGGNTILFSIDRSRTLKIVAQTVDDAAGEALDKGAKLLGMVYPGGPLIEKRAADGDSEAYDFPRAFPGARELKFSFSGLKTSLRYLLEKLDDDALEAAFADICASYQAAVVDALVRKTRQVLRSGEGDWRSVGLSGGVANNKTLRAAMQKMAAQEKVPLFVAEPRHTGDNAGMIAFAAWADPAGLLDIDALGFDPSLPLA